MNAAPEDRIYAVGWCAVGAGAGDAFEYVKSEIDARGGASPLYRFTHDQASRIARALAVQPHVGQVSIRSMKPRPEASRTRGEGARP